MTSFDSIKIILVALLFSLTLGSKAEAEEHRKLFVSAGISVFPAICPSLEGGYYLDSNDAIVVGHHNMFIPFGSVSSTSTGIAWRHFVWKALYTDLGLSYTEAHLRHDSETGGNRFGRGRAEALTARLGIGSQWNVGRLLLGAKWLGVDLPVKSVKVVEFSDGSTGEASNIELLRFDIGVRF